MKTCTKCGETKPPTEFSKDVSKRDGLRPQCKTCHNNAVASYRFVNSEKKRASDAKYRAANPEKVKAYAAKWRAANPEKRRAINAKWASANPEKQKAAIAKWAADHPETLRIYEQNRRVRYVGKLTPGLAGRLFTLQRGKCACGCGLPLGNNFHRDHIMPLALGGTNTDDNIQLLRQRCNNQKSAKHPVDFMQSRGFLL